MRIPIENSPSYRGRDSRHNGLALFGFTALALAAGVVATLFSPASSPSAAVWYMSLVKPDWAAAPKTWYDVTWALVYVSLAIAPWLISRERYHRMRNRALFAYAVQLILNASWAPVFFGARNVGGGLFVIVALWLSLVWTIQIFALVRPLASWILVPYFVGASLGVGLCLDLWRHNP